MSGSWSSLLRSDGCAFISDKMSELLVLAGSYRTCSWSEWIVASLKQQRPGFSYAVGREGKKNKKPHSRGPFPHLSHVIPSAMFPHQIPLSHLLTHRILFTFSARHFAAALAVLIVGSSNRIYWVWGAFYQHATSCKQNEGRLSRDLFPFVISFFPLPWQEWGLESVWFVFSSGTEATGRAIASSEMKFPSLWYPLCYCDALAVNLWTETVFDVKVDTGVCTTLPWLYGHCPQYVSQTDCSANRWQAFLRNWNADFNWVLFRVLVRPITIMTF